MELSTFDAASVPTFTLAAVQLLKDFGLEGNWLKLASAVIGALAVSLAMFQPELWAALYAMAIGGTTTGFVSFVKDLIERHKR